MSELTKYRIDEVESGDGMHWFYIWKEVPMFIWAWDRLIPRRKCVGTKWVPYICNGMNGSWHACTRSREESLAWVRKVQAEELRTRPSKLIGHEMVPPLELPVDKP